MRSKLLRLIYVLFLFLTLKCNESKIKNETVIIYCDYFPSFKIDSVIMDTFGFKKFVTDKLGKFTNDSIIFTIECPENIVIENVLQTERILKNQIYLTNKFKTKFRINNKCLNELSPPNQNAKNVNAGIVIRTDYKGNLFLNDTSITLEVFCLKFKGQKVRVKIIADKTLPANKLISILEKLNREGFEVSMG